MYSACKCGVVEYRASENVTSYIIVLTVLMCSDCYTVTAVSTAFYNNSIPNRELHLTLGEFGLAETLHRFTLDPLTVGTSW